MILSTGQNVKPHNSKEEPIMTNIEKAIALEVDGIITNVPDRVLAALGR